MSTKNPLDYWTWWRSLPHQNEAIFWLWSQIPEATRAEFARRYTPPNPPLTQDLPPGETVVGWQRTSPAFRAKLCAIAEKLGIAPLWLAAVISFETGGTFSPSIRNMAGSGATGLIQFMPATAISLGTTTDKLAAMDATTQLDWVARYFQPYQGRMHTLRDCYMAVLWPAAVGRGPDFILFKSPSIAYRQNAGLDWDRDGCITAQEAARKVEAQIRKTLA